MLAVRHPQHDCVRKLVSSHAGRGMFAWSQTSPFLFSGCRMHAIAIFDSLPLLAVVNLRHMLFSTFPRNDLSFRAVTSLLFYVVHTAGLMRLPLRKRASLFSSTINWTSEGLLPRANHTCAIGKHCPIGQTHGATFASDSDCPGTRNPTRCSRASKVGDDSGIRRAHTALTISALRKQ